MCLGFVFAFISLVVLHPCRGSCSSWVSPAHGHFSARLIIPEIHEFSFLVTFLLETSISLSSGCFFRPVAQLLAGVSLPWFSRTCLDIWVGSPFLVHSTVWARAPRGQDYSLVPCWWRPHHVFSWSAGPVSSPHHVTPLLYPESNHMISSFSAHTFLWLPIYKSSFQNGSKREIHTMNVRKDLVRFLKYFYYVFIRLPES